jgi:hypothetical protein
MLSDYSAQTLPILLALLPELTALVTVQDDVFEMRLTTPAGWVFWLSSDDADYLTVGLADYHCHFGNFAGTTPEQDAAAAAAFIEALQAGELVVVEQYRGEEMVGSWVQAATDALPSNTASDTPFQGSKERFEVKSWNT